MAITITRGDVDRESFEVLKMLRGFRFRLDRRIEQYPHKTDGKKVFSSLCEYAKLHEAIAAKSKSSGLEDPAAAISSHVGAQAITLEFGYGGTRQDFFSGRSLSYTSDEDSRCRQLEIYCHTLDEGKKSLEEITGSFFQWIAEDSARVLESYTRDKQRLDGFSCKTPCGTFLIQRPSDIKPSRKGSIDPLDYAVNPGTQDGEETKLYIYGHESVKKEFEKISTIIEKYEFLSSLFPPRDLFRDYLLVGPPGTGKTSLVRHFAAKSGAYFMKIPCVELGSKFYSETATNIHEAYKSAKEIMKKGSHRCVILFFDEIDHIAKRRGYGNSGESDTLITTLNENIDGGSSQPGIVTIGATNNEDIIDPAILSRMEILYVGYPASEEEIEGIHQSIIDEIESFSGKKIFGDVDYKEIFPYSAKDERFKSGREIRRIIMKATLGKALDYVRKEKHMMNFPFVTTEDIRQAYASHAFEQRKDAGKEPIGYLAPTK